MASQTLPTLLAMSELCSLWEQMAKPSNICSGTLISPTVFLAVAHCADYFNDFLAPQGFKLYMSFGNPIPILELTDVSTWIPVTQFIPYSKVRSSERILTLLTRTTVAIPATLLS